MREQIIDLWKISFGDSDDFIRLWFDRVYKDEQTLVIRQNDKIVSALQILPYEMTYCKTTIPIGYICGVCTLPSERGKSYMNQLMCQAVTAMQNQHYVLAVLIPATPLLFDLYRRFKFANAFDYSIEEIQSNNSFNHSDSSIQIVSYEKLSQDLIYAYYHTKQRERDCSILHSADQFETICQDWILGRGEIWTAISDNQLVGLMFTEPVTNDTLSIREIMVDDVATKNKLVQSILNHHQLKIAKLRIPPDRSNSNAYGMARIINKEQMIDTYCSFHTASPLPDLINLDIPLLTQTLLKYDQRQPYLNLMMD